MTQNIVFVSGVARSGTSAMVNVLNRNPRIMVGQERYFFLVKQERLTAAEFEKERFLTFHDGDSHSQAISTNPEKREEAFDRAIWIGDKFPLLYNHFDYIFREFPEARHIYIFRNPLSVIESYDARQRNPKDSFRKTWKDGLREWNESVARVAALAPEDLSRFHLVQYEDFFSTPDRMNALFNWLGVPRLKPEKLASFVEKYRELGEKPVPRRDDMRQHVALNADWDAYRTLHRMALEQRTGTGGPAGRETRE